MFRIEIISEHILGIHHCLPTLKDNANGKMFSFQPAFLLHLEPFANSLKQCSRSYDGSDILLANFCVAVAVLETVPIMRRRVTCIRKSY